MGEPQYMVAFDGSVKADCDVEQVKARLAAALNLRPEHLERLFSGRPVTVKRGLSQVQALRLQSIFDEAGAVCEVIAEPQAAADHSATASGDAAAIASRAQTSESARPGGASTQAGSGARPRPGPGDIPTLFASRPRPSPPDRGGRFSLVGAAAAALFVPVLYALLLIAVGGATLWHAFHGLLYLEQRSFAGAWFVYLTPMALGATVFVYLLKPVLARALAPPGRIELEPLREPVLLALVQHVAEVLGTPRPERIWVDVRPAASLDWSRGIMELTIGMPLLAGLSARQLVGVLGQEFGYFAQGPESRATYLVRRAHQWLDRVTRERDAWDAAIAAWEDSPSNWRVSLSRALGASFQAQRRALVGLARWDRTLSRRMLSRMELDADYCQAQLAGSDHFRATVERVLMLRQAAEDVYHHLSVDGRPGGSPDDLAAAIVARADELAALSNSTPQVQPPMAERIARAEALNAPASFTLDIPARGLLKKYERLASRTTDAFYRDVPGMAPAHEAGVSSAAPGHDAGVVSAAPAPDEVLSDYCRELFVPDRFIAPQPWRDYQALTPEARRERLDALVARLGQDMPEIARRVASWQVEAQPAPDPGTPAPQSESMGGEPDGALRRHEAVLAERLAVALGGLIQEAGEHAEVAREIERLLAVQARLAELGQSYQALKRGLDGPDAGADASGGDLSEHLERIKTELAKVAYPFSHAGGELSVFAQFHADLPELTPDEPARSREYGRALTAAVALLYRRVFARLAELARGYERGMGVVPMGQAPAAAPASGEAGAVGVTAAAPDGA